MPFDALRALGEGLAGRDAAARVAGLRRALALDPAYDEAALALGRLLVDAGRFEEAREAVARVGPGLSASPATPASSTGWRCSASAASARPTSSTRSSPRSGRPRPRSAIAAVARLRAGPAGGASTLLRQAVEAAPASIDLPFNLGWALLVEGEPEAAAFWLRGAVRRDPGDAQGRLLLSWALLASGRAEEAEEQWRAAAALTPALGPLRRPDLSRRLERVLPSEQGLVLDPERAADAEASRGHAARGEALLAAGDRAGAVSRARARGPPRPLLPRARTSCSGGRTASRGENEKAVAELRMALWCRDDPALRREIAELPASAGWPGGAERDAPSRARRERARGTWLLVVSPFRRPRRSVRR